ncbi:MAG: helix-turn-helix transcriptional regulator [Proteobacteria bacterium]|nr:helix-turn-helix transcriptional regulator [Pseudomonadota bacterium]
MKRPARKSLPRTSARRRRRRRSYVDGPDPVDVYVGARVRERRVALGMSQTDLAALIGLTFQQVQKYERGTNRLSASALWRAAKALGVPVLYFFDGLTGRAVVGPDEERDVVTMHIARKIRALQPQIRDILDTLVDALIQRTSR